MKQDIQNRDHIHHLITAFYTKIRKSLDIGFFFNDTILDWPEHLEKLTDFWETQLFIGGTYRGNPLAAHAKVDHQFHHSITQEHFGLWLNLWFETIDELYQGETAEMAKRKAQKMSTMMYINIYQERDSLV